MMPGARFFFITRPSPLSSPMGGQGEPITIGSEKGRCSPHPPRGPYS
jgi:hypothetical protein